MILRNAVAGLFSLFLWHGMVSADVPDSLPLVQAALEKLDATNLDDDWYFTMEVVDGEELQVIESDPTRETHERRQLRSVNGETPDDERLAEFREAEETRIGDIDPKTASYEYMVDTKTLELIRQEIDHMELSFVPRVKAMEDSRDRLRGTLLLNTATSNIDKLEIYNTEKLPHAFSVNIDTYRLALIFYQEGGASLLQKLESHAVGTAGFLKNFDSKVEVIFSDYRRADH